MDYLASMDSVANMPTCTSFLWTLIYDSEKAKVVCKNLGFGNVVRDVLVHVRVGMGGERADDDEIMIIQALRNLDALKKLLT